MSMANELLQAKEREVLALQSQLAAANERADNWQKLWDATTTDMVAARRERDGLQKIVDAARAQKPYAYEHGVSNGGGTFSVHITRGDMEQVGPTSYAYCAPKNPHKDWPVKPLYAAPVPAQPAVVPECCNRPVRNGFGFYECCNGINRSAVEPTASILSTTDTEVSAAPEIFPGTTNALAKLSIKPKE